MIRLASLLPLALAACASDPIFLPPPAATVPPVVAKVSLQGRWNIATVNGRQSNGLWLDLGGEGLGTVTKSESGALLVRSPQPRTRAFLGCNDWHPNGWARNGDKLTLGREMSFRTERGCDPDTVALDDQAYAILSNTMTMEFTSPSRLRLSNQNGTLDLARLAPHPTSP